MQPWAGAALLMGVLESQRWDQLTVVITLRGKSDGVKQKPK